MKRVINTALAILLLISCFVSQTYAQQPAAGSSDSGVVKKVLDNGLTVIVKPEKGSGLVAVIAFIRVGAAQESLQAAGIGNFVAHLVLASTRVKSAEEVASVADEVGGNISAQWHEDYTEIRAITTSAKFGSAMNLIGECLTEANFEPKWVDTIRAELLRAVRADSDDVFQDAYTDLRQMMYEDNGYRRSPLGTERTIKLATPDDLQKYYSSYYVPNNIVLSIVGDVTVDQAVQRADMAFAGVSPAKLPIDRGVPDETLDRCKYRASEVDLGAAYLLTGWLCPGVMSPDFPAMTVAVNALGGGKCSLMFRELREKRGMGYDIGTVYPSLRYQSHVLAYVITDPFKNPLPGSTPTLVLNDVKSALLEQVDTLKNKPLSPTDLERAKGYTIGTYALQHQRMLDRAFQLGWLETVGLGYEHDKKLMDAVDKVTAEDVQRVSRKYFTNYAAVLLLPRVQSPSTDSPTE